MPRARQPLAPADSTPQNPLEKPPRASRRGHGRVTLQDVATTAGVTAITVSRYLREPSIVAGATAQRISQAIAQTGYVPNKQAGLLASGRSNIVAALLPNLANSIFAETAQGLSDALQAAGFELLIAGTNYSLEREAQQLHALLGWQPAAMVVTGRRHTPAATALLVNAHRNGMPLVEIWDWQEPRSLAHKTRSHASRPADPALASSVELPQTFAQVGFSHDEVGRAMAQHLLSRGHRHIAYVDSGVAEDYRAHERGVGFVQASRECGATATCLVAQAGDGFDAGRHMLDRLLTLESPVVAGPVRAAAFANDHLASGALLEAVQRGVPVPQRLALLGFGDFAWSRHLHPSLSSVQLPRYQIGEQAARRLLAMLAGGDPAEPQQMPWQIVGRDSTA